MIPPSRTKSNNTVGRKGLVFLEAVAGVTDSVPTAAAEILAPEGAGRSISSISLKSYEYSETLSTFGVGVRVSDRGLGGGMELVAEVEGSLVGMELLVEFKGSFLFLAGGSATAASIAIALEEDDDFCRFAFNTI
jgi:hypothetical protein